MVIWSEPAKADLRSIHDFIANYSRHYARKVAQDIAAKTDMLNDLPRMGQVVPERGDENIRECRFIPIAYYMKSKDRTYSYWP